MVPFPKILSHLVARGRSAGPFFNFTSASVLSREGLLQRVRQALEEGGVSASTYSSHSFRIGAASAAGIEDSLIKTLGRWESSAYLLYVRIAREALPKCARNWQ